MHLYVLHICTFYAIIVFQGYCIKLHLLVFKKIASEGLKHRVFEVSLADLQKDEDQAYRKIRLRAEDVQGKNVLTNFWVCTISFAVLVFLDSNFGRNMTYYF